MIKEIHIASMIIHVHPPRLMALLSFIDTHPAIELRAQSPAGKVVIVAESEQQKAMLDVIDTLEQFSGVLSCTMVYHEVMDESLADEMIPVWHRTTQPGGDTQILTIQTEMTS